MSVYFTDNLIERDVLLGMSLPFEGTQNERAFVTFVFKIRKNSRIFHDTIR